jgi:hypothetical protein
LLFTNTLVKPLRIPIVCYATMIFADVATRHCVSQPLRSRDDRGRPKDV